MESMLMLTLVFLILLTGNHQQTAVDSQVIQGNAQGLQNAKVGLPVVNGKVPFEVDHDQSYVNQGAVAKPRRKKKKKRAKRSEINSVNKPVVDSFNHVDTVGKNHNQLVKTPHPLPLDGVNNLNNIVHNNLQPVKNVPGNVVKPDESLMNSARNQRLGQQNGQESDNAVRNVIRNRQDSGGSYKGNVNHQQPNFVAPPGAQIPNLNDQPPGPGIGQESNNAQKNLQFAQVHDNVANVRGNERKNDPPYVNNGDRGNPSKDKFVEVVTEQSRNNAENHQPLIKDDSNIIHNNIPNNNFQNFPQNADSNNNINNDNNINNNNNNNDNSNFGGQQWNPVPQQNNPQKKQDSMRIMWDWSDFLINYEQYVMPEQKVRRAPHATTGEPWPLPQYYITSKTKLFRLDKEKFHFRISKETCDVIEKATERYKDTILYDTVQDMYDNLQHAQGSSLEDVYEKYGNEIHSQAQYIEELNIKIRQPCTKFPSEKMDESYDLFVKRTGAFLWANEVWGALRGLETFSQLVFKGTNDELYIRDTVINDYPRFPHRGILLDSSRHYIFKEVIFDVLEGMSQNKMNVLHWHIVDDQSFPYQSKMYPDLSDKGAYHPTFVYTHEDIDEIIEYARLRGIRVMPEFDTPGHTYSWGLSRPDLLTQCYQGSHPVNGYLGPLDPSKNETYRFLRNLFNEVLQVFKDDYIHLGGDEVPMTCWSSNPEVLALLNRLEGKPDQPINLNNVDPYMYSYDIRKVLEFYEKRLTQSLKEIGKRRKNGVRFVMWQEIMNNNIQLPNDTIIQIWQGDMSDVQRAIDMGYQTLYSTCWYLDLIEYGVKWPKYYNCDPADTSMGYQIDEKKVLGGEACLWAEYIDNENLMSTLWPRASATAERLWSSKDVKDVEAAGTRLSEHRCRMLSRGLSVGQISGPDYCLRRGHRRDRENQGNCSSGHCMAQKNMVQIERIDLRVHQRANPLPDCNQIISHGGSAVSVFLVLVVFLAIIISIKVGGTRMVQVRFCKNKNIFIAFVVILLVYFMCSTSLWMQVLEFKGSFEKRIKSSYSDKG